MYETST
jgi:hypothetical protein